MFCKLKNHVSANFYEVEDRRERENDLSQVKIER